MQLPQNTLDIPITEKTVGQTFWLKHSGSWFAFAEPVDVRDDGDGVYFVTKLDSFVTKSAGQNIGGSGEPFNDILKEKGVDFPIEYRGYKIYPKMGLPTIKNNPVSGHSWLETKETSKFIVEGRGASAARTFGSLERVKSEIDFLIKFPSPEHWKADIGPGNEVYWADPDNDILSGYYSVVDVLTGSGKIESGDTVLRLKNLVGIECEVAAKEIYLEKPAKVARPKI